jgi:hypothetical protein
MGHGLNSPVVRSDLANHLEPFIGLGGFPRVYCFHSTERF